MSVLASGHVANTQARCVPTAGRAWPGERRLRLRSPPNQPCQESAPFYATQSPGPESVACGSARRPTCTVLRRSLPARKSSPAAPLAAQPTLPGVCTVLWRSLLALPAPVAFTQPTGPAPLGVTAGWQVSAREHGRLRPPRRRENASSGAGPSGSCRTDVAVLPDTIAPAPSGCDARGRRPASPVMTTGAAARFPKAELPVPEEPTRIYLDYNASTPVAAVRFAAIAAPPRTRVSGTPRAGTGRAAPRGDAVGAATAARIASLLGATRTKSC